MVETCVLPYLGKKIITVKISFNQLCQQNYVLKVVVRFQCKLYTLFRFKDLFLSCL